MANKMTLRKKYKFARIRITLTIIIFLIGIIYSIIIGRYLFSIILFLLLYLSSFLGKKTPKLYLQLSFVNFIKRNGNTISKSQAMDYYAKTYKGKNLKEQDIQEFMNDLLNTMVKDGIIKYENDPGKYIIRQKISRTVPRALS